MRIAAPKIADQVTEQHQRSQKPRTSLLVYVILVRTLSATLRSPMHRLEARLGRVGGSVGLERLGRGHELEDDEQRRVGGRVLEHVPERVGAASVSARLRTAGT